MRNFQFQTARQVGKCVMAVTVRLLNFALLEMMKMLITGRISCVRQRPAPTSRQR